MTTHSQENCDMFCHLSLHGFQLMQIIPKESGCQLLPATPVDEVCTPSEPNLAD